MPGFLVLCGLLLATTLTAAEGWRPAEHPADVVRPVGGLTRPVRIVAIAAEVAGRITDPGPAVAANTSDGRLQLEDRLARLDRDSAGAAVAQAQADSTYRTREAERIERLAGDGRVSDGERDAARYAAEAARLALLRSQADLARSDELLARHRVDLPAGWRVLRRMHEAGAVVQPGQAVLEIGDLSTVVVTLHLAEDEIAALPAAQVVVAGQPVAVRAVRIADQADALSRKRPVEVELDGAAGGGREALVMLRLPDPAKALAVPATLIRADLDGRFVHTSDGRSLRVTVLRQTSDGMLAVLPDEALAGATLVAP